MKQTNTEKYVAAHAFRNFLPREREQKHKPGKCQGDQEKPLGGVPSAGRRGGDTGWKCAPGGNQRVPSKGHGVVQSLAKLEASWSDWRVGCLRAVVRCVHCRQPTTAEGASPDTSSGQSVSKHLLRPRGLSYRSSGVPSKVWACP